MRPARRLLGAALAAGVASAGLLTGLPAAAAARDATMAAPGLTAASPGRSGAVTAPPPGPAGVVAGGADLVNAVTGHRMWSRGVNVERPIASITKVMTALVVLRAGDLNRQIKVTRAAVDYGQAYGASEAGLIPGDFLTVRQLLAGLLLPSGSDAAYLLAGSYGPGWPRFVRKMNAEARALGMTRTHYANFDGLPWPTEYTTYSTPHDLMLLAAAVMKSAAFRQIVSQGKMIIPATRRHHRYYWKNTNLLISRFKGTIGIKTGYTAGAGYCLLFAASRNGHELTGVVLNSTGTDTEERFTAAAKLLRWGFAQLAG
jgi:serine-type D-Ala-D-Ala carboxypeptidase (penicillin-binding protein 5/6)